MAKCLVCGAAHAACGPRTTVIPVDERVALRRDADMGELKQYEVEVPGRNGRSTRTTLLLSDEDAERQGLTGGVERLAPPADTSDTPPNKAAVPEGTKKPRFGRTK